MNEIRAAQEDLNRTFSEAVSPSTRRARARPGQQASRPDRTDAASRVTGTGQAPNEDVVEADYEIVDENKK
jgi:hypothetical protein